MTSIAFYAILIAMKTQNGNLHLEIQNSRKSPVGILRTSFYLGGKILHTQHGRITGCSIEQLKMLQLAFRENVISIDDPKAFKIIQSKEFGASYVLYEIIKKPGWIKQYIRVEKLG